MIVPLAKRLLSVSVRCGHLTAHYRQMCTASEVLFQEVGSKGIITLNRPQALNALTLNMIRLMYVKLKEWEQSKAMVIVKGSGAKAFCAGGDVVSITEAGKTGDALARDFFREEYHLDCLIGTYHIPYIALIDGITMGGGVGITVHGQYRVASENTLFAMPETAIGLFPDVGGSYFLPRLGGKLGLFLALTGHRLKGKDILKAGIATHLCKSSSMSELEERLLQLEPVYPERITEIIDKMTREFPEEGDFSLKPQLSIIDKCFSGSSIEEIMDNLQMEGCEWSKKQLSILQRMSPTSLKITFEQLRRGAHLTLQECLSMEYRLGQRFCADHDFYEGVRAVLVDKDNTPKWKPTLLSEVTPDVIDKYFAPLPPNEELKF